MNPIIYITDFVIRSLSFGCMDVITERGTMQTCGKRYVLRIMKKLITLVTQSVRLLVNILWSLIGLNLKLSFLFDRLSYQG